jgi:putative phosphoribosyl transferase
MATGLSMQAAVLHCRRHGADRVVVAVPCASAPALRRVEAVADSVVTLAVEADVDAVGRSYADAAPVTDEAALGLLGGAPESGDRPAALALAIRNPAGLFLAGTVRLPAGDGPHPAVVLAHRLGSRADTPRNRATAAGLTRAGLAVLGFDFTGHGDSEGIVEDSTLPRQVEDLGAALTALGGLDEVDSRRLGVLAVESGAAPALAWAASDPRIRALVLRSPRVREVLAVAPRVHAPTLVIAGARDPAGEAAAAELIQRLGGARRLATVAAGDHLFHDPDALGEAGALAAEWFRLHLGAERTAPPGPAAPRPPDSPPGSLEDTP